MKRSEANLHAKARLEYSKEYECFSIKRVDENGDACDHDSDCDCECSEEYFSHSGCDICSNLPCGGAGTVIDVIFLARNDVKNKVFDNVLEGQLCSGCLCSMVNGDGSDLDYSVTTEDEEKKS